MVDVPPSGLGVPRCHVALSNQSEEASGHLVTLSPDHEFGGLPALSCTLLRYPALRFREASGHLVT